MTDNETKRIIERIKNNFSEFRSTDKGVIQEWCSRLSKYDYQDINKALDEYLEYGKEAPLISVLTSKCKTLEEKGQEEHAIYQCGYCNRWHKSLNSADECYDRDIAIHQIEKYSKLFAINENEYFRPELRKCGLEEINANYKNFIIRVIKEEKKEPKLSEMELKSLKLYYENVIKEK